MKAMFYLGKLKYASTSLNINFSVRNLCSLSSNKFEKFSSKYRPGDVEKDKYEKWENNASKSYIKRNGNKFVTIIPPPNITGTLHLGHALTLTIQDVLCRWNKMCGNETVWIPGMDHAGIATQVVVEKKIWKEKKKTRHDLGRKEFIDEVWKWKDQKAETIRKQMKKLGALPDWEKELFTMDKKQSDAVNTAFIRLFESGLIYRSDHLINWSCILQSAISDIEVEHIELSGRTEIKVPGYEQPIEFGTITKFAYKLFENDGELPLCTTRPETIFGDVAVAVNPSDERYTHLHGKHVLHPFRNEPIPIICDTFVDPEFGTGVVKVTPAHDMSDFEVGKRHNLTMLKVIDESGSMNSNCDKSFQGLKRFHARKVVLEKLGEMGLLHSINDHAMKVPICSRSKDVIEFLVKPQWFIDCKNMADKAISDVKSGKLQIDPPNYEKVWFNWLENIRDWCISRQLWWGHRIPAYECYVRNDSDKKIWVAAHNEEEARKKASSKLSTISENIVVTQDNDVLDTWFSSGLLPFSVFGWPKKSEDFQKYYPLSLIETGHDILFFWVARMVMLGTELTGQLPFSKILLHGIICDAHGRKMSKSLGNVVSPEDVIDGITLENLSNQTKMAYDSGLLSLEELDRAISGQNKMFPSGIPECGADALRFTLCSHNTKNHFINFNISECHSNRLFCNKIWQACNYTLSYTDQISKKQNLSVEFTPSIIDKWILSRLSFMISEVNSAVSKTDLHIATAAIKQFLYTEFCDVYVEATKLELKKDGSSKAVAHIKCLIQCLQSGLRYISPFMPFLSEELYSYLSKHPAVDMHLNKESSFPEVCDHRNELIEEEIQIILDAVSVIRRMAKLSNITSKNKPRVYIVTSASVFQDHCDIIKALTNYHNVNVVSEMNVNMKTVSDTVGNYGVVHLELPQSIQENASNETDRLAKKMSKLIDKIDKMRKMVDQDSYKEQAPIKVQETHSKQLSSLQEELHRLQQLHQSFKL